jgi:hypothetical protein
MFFIFVLGLCTVIKNYNIVICLLGIIVSSADFLCLTMQDEMEKKMADQQPDAQQEHMSVSNKVVADVLADHSKRNKFLQNVGIQFVQPRTTVQNLQEQLE